MTGPQPATPGPLTGVITAGFGVSPSAVPDAVTPWTRRWLE